MSLILKKKKKKKLPQSNLHQQQISQLPFLEIGNLENQSGCSKIWKINQAAVATQDNI